MGVAVLLLLAAMTAAPGTARATPVTYDATADFSITNGNPNGTWSYGYETSGGSAFIPYATVVSGSSYMGWNISGSGDPVIWKNISASSILGNNPGQVALHPGPAGQASIARWTAPGGIGSIVSIAGQFFAGDSGTMQVGIFLDNNWSTPLFQATDHGSFSFVQAVAPGTTIDFAVYGGYSNGTTPFDARITEVSNAVPEIDPAGLGTVLALVTGVLGLVERRRATA